MNDDNVNYYLTYQGQEEQEVNKAAFIVAERQAGFRPKLASTDPEYMNTCATGGFCGNGVKGRIQYDSPTGRLTQSQPQLQAVPGSPTVALEMAAAGVKRTVKPPCSELLVWMYQSNLEEIETANPDMPAKQTRMQAMQTISDCLTIPLEKVIAHMKAELARVLIDANRYHWLRVNNYDVGSFHGKHTHNAEAWFEHLDDAAIDAAIADEAEK